jgi:hypothetical protein
MDAVIRFCCRLKRCENRCLINNIDNVGEFGELIERKALKEANNFNKDLYP